MFSNDFSPTISMTTLILVALVSLCSGHAELQENSSIFRDSASSRMLRIGKEDETWTRNNDKRYRLVKDNDPSSSRLLGKLRSIIGYDFATQRARSLSDDIGWKKRGSDLDGNYYYDKAGGAVAINSDGSRVAIGAHDSQGERGSVRIFDWDDASDNWVQIGYDILGVPNDEFGSSLDMSNDGSRIIAGSPRHQNYYGTTRIFQWDPDFGAWVQLGRDLDGEERYDEVGEAVTISGDGNRIAIGAPESNEKLGYVQVYELDTDSDDWEMLGQKLVGTSYYSRNGNSVSLNYDGNRLVVGSHFNPVEEDLTGSTTVWEFDGVQWVQMGGAIHGSSFNELFGHSVDIDRDGARIVISAINAESDSGLYNTGMVQVYQYSNDDWVQLGSTVYGANTADSLGESVSISGAGDRIIVGAKWADDGAVNAGQARVYDYDAISDEWTQVGDTILGECSANLSGEAVAISEDGSHVIVGAPYNNYYSGHARVYEATPGYKDDNLDHCFDVPVTQTPTMSSTKSPSPTLTPTSPPSSISISSSHPTSQPSSTPTIEHSTNAPSLQPSSVMDSTTSPSSAPTSSFCVDSPIPYLLSGLSQNCSGLKLRVNVDDLCSDITSQSHCPVACGSCSKYACSDSEATFILSGVGESTCADMQGYGQVEREQICNDYPNIRDTCRSTCNLCEG